MEIKLTNILFSIWKEILKFFMRTFILLCCTTVLSFSSYNLSSQVAKVSIDTDKTFTIFEIFDLIGKQTECTFIFQSDIFKDVPEIHLKTGVIEVMKLLSKCLPDKNFEININKDQLITISRKSSKEIQQKEIQIKGKIKDSDGMPIAGATIMVKGTNRGTTSDFDGNFEISANSDDILIISYLGYKTISQNVNGQKTINMILEPDAENIKEVVINAGYYTVKAKEQTGNIATIKAKTIEKQPVNNPIAAMQGHLSGVNIVQATGVPGGGYHIEVRGRNFINGVSDPLFIVDGVPFGSQSLGANEVSGFNLGGNISPLNALNPNDIESIEVLKDADATAIYGSRAANGVVLITTKKGKTGKTQFQANVSSTIGKVSKFLELMNTEQYLEIRREGITNDGYGAFLDNPAFDFAWPDLKSWDNSRYTDWQKKLIGGTAYQNNTQISVSGGNQQTRFLISGAHHKETTVFPGDSNYKKSSFHSNVNHRSDNDRFTMNLSTLYSFEDNSLPRTDFTYLAYTLEPNAPKLYDDNGQLNWENNTWNNPLASLDELYNAKINTLVANAITSYEIVPQLELKSSFGFNTYRLNSYQTKPSSATSPSLGFNSQNYSSSTTNDSHRSSWIVEPQLNWKTKRRNTNIDILIGTTFQQETTQQFVIKGTGFPNNQLLRNLTAAENVEVIRDADSKYSYNAIFGRVNVNMAKKYIVNLTGRRDGSSRFGPSRQFGNFGAVGMAWLFSEETTFKKSSLLSFGKLRSSYGITGSDNIGDYRFLDTYNITGFDYNGTTVLEPTGIFNPLFGWESNSKLEAAIELGFFKDRLFFNASWYTNRSSNQLIGIPLAATTGFSEVTGNFDATVENTGFEIDARTLNIQNGTFKWSTTFNIAIPKNKLVEFEGLETSTFANRFIIGKPVTIVKLYNALGVDPETGIYQFEDYNDDGGISSLDDRQLIEDFAPKFFGGLGNTLSYGNFTLDVFFQFKKQKAFNELTLRAKPGGRGNSPASLLDRWQQPGDLNPIQMASGGLGFGVDTNALQQNSTAAISDASFIRLRNVSLNYKIPNGGNHIDINVYLQGQNLLTFTNFNGPDPEQPIYSRLPPLKQITLGLQIGF